MTYADLSQLPPIEAEPSEFPNLADELFRIIRHAISDAPRSKQRTIGPSEIGTPCSRRLGYHFLDVPKVNYDPAPWIPTVGTAIHMWLEDVFKSANLEHEPGLRWLIEHRVNVGEIGDESINGSCDLYDRVTRTVVDWKSCGVTALRNYRKAGPGDTYRTQLHLYGRGWTRRGLPVDRVALIALPRNAELADAYIWHEPYNEQLAVDALDRATRIKEATTAGPTVLPFLRTANAHCGHCPWYLPAATELGEACPGHTETGTTTKT
jgi:hypothetical protein